MQQRRNKENRHSNDSRSTGVCLFIIFSVCTFSVRTILAFPVSDKYARESLLQCTVKDKSEYADRDYLPRADGADGEQVRL